MTFFVIGGIIETAVGVLLIVALGRLQGLMELGSVLILLICHAAMTGYGTICMLLLDIPIAWSRRDARWPSLWAYALVLGPAQVVWWDIVRCRDAAAALDRQYLIIIAAVAPGLSLLTAVWSLLRFQDDLPNGSPRGRSLSFAVLLAVTTMAGTAAVLANPSRPPLSFHWDFSARHDPATANWPADTKGNLKWYGQRKISLDAQIDSHRQYANHDVWDICLIREGPRLRSVAIHEKPATADQVAGRAAELIREWGAEPIGVDGWLSMAPRNDLNRYLMNIRSKDNAHEPEIAVEIIPAIGWGDTPWYVSVQLFWPDEPPARQMSSSR